MPRAKRPTGDTAYNARRRYYRSAERYLKQAQQTTGATAARYRALAQSRLNEAINTYSGSTTQDFAKPIQRLANELGVDLNKERQIIKSRTEKQEQEIRGRAIDEARSRTALESASQDIATRREAEARTILNSPIGKRIIGGTVEIWQDEATVTDDYGSSKIDKRKILPALFDFFKVVTGKLADLLDRIETIVGDLLYHSPDEEAFYESAKITIQQYVRGNRPLIGK